MYKKKEKKKNGGDFGNGHWIEGSLRTLEEAIMVNEGVPPPPVPGGPILLNNNSVLNYKYPSLRISLLLQLWLLVQVKLN
jgi:hypothetical protein